MDKNADFRIFVSLIGEVDNLNLFAVYTPVGVNSAA